MRQALASVLEAAGFAVEPYATGSQLAERLLGRPAGSLPRADVVVTDICMPGCTGLEVLQALRRGHDPVPVLLMSGSLDPMAGKGKPDQGVVAFLSKPFDLGEFVSTVRRLAGQQREAGLSGTLRGSVLN